MEYTGHYDSPLGAMTLAGDGEALTGLWFDGQKYFGRTIRGDSVEKQLPVFEQTECWLDLYFSGKPPEFTPPLNLRGTAFQRAVWEILMTVPFGETVTYGQIARRLAGPAGRLSAQAVGGAVGRNPVLLIVPCHRVIGADGSLTGYAAGTERKKRLLAMENPESRSI